jgi:hypothetical protein
MPTKLRHVFPLVVAGAAAGIFGLPVAGADTTLINPTLPSCVQTGGSSVIGGTTTECETPGNVELNATPEVPEDFAYPWGYDDFVGAPFVFGGPFVGPRPGPGPAPHGGGGGGGGH